MSADASECSCEWYFGVPFQSKRKAAGVKERELKVGDRVKTHGCFSFDPVHGVVVEARDGGVYRVRVEALHRDMGGRDTLTYYTNELILLPPTFAPNTRVRVIRNTLHYAVGDTGTVTVSSDESVGVIMDDGRYWSFKPEDLVVAPSPWGVVPAPDCAGRNGEQGLEFKDGDHLLCLEDCEPGVQFTKGRVYIARGDAISDHVSIVKDDKGSSRNGWNVKFFQLYYRAPAPVNDPATPCIVMRLENGQPRPSSWPHVHQSAADATKEAERLASVNPGKQFDVYQRVTGRVGDVQVREVA